MKKKTAVSMGSTSELCLSISCLLFQQISAVIVGADRIAANGDTANKIGTLQLAIAASHFGIPFYVAAPTTTIDLNTKTGNEIPIEDRSSDEITLCKCSSKARIPPEGQLKPGFQSPDKT